MVSKHLLWNKFDFTLGARCAFRVIIRSL